MTSPLRPVSAGAAKFSKSKPERRIFVLDTNVLMHDPTSIFRFEEHDVYIPMTVLEELDAGKKGVLAQQAGPPAGAPGGRPATGGRPARDAGEDLVDLIESTISPST